MDAKPTDPLRVDGSTLFSCCCCCRPTRHKATADRPLGVVLRALLLLLLMRRRRPARMRRRAAFRHFMEDGVGHNGHGMRGRKRRRRQWRQDGKAGRQGMMLIHCRCRRAVHGRDGVPCCCCRHGGRLLLEGETMRTTRCSRWGETTGRRQVGQFEQHGAANLAIFAGRTMAPMVQ